MIIWKTRMCSHLGSSHYINLDDLVSRDFAEESTICIISVGSLRNLMQDNEKMAVNQPLNK